MNEQVQAIMDYKKLYEEALERARNLYPGVHSHNKAMLEQIFPELREDEDEIIREWLVDYFSSIKSGVWIHRNTITCEQILTWLEKQKEPQNKSMAHEDSSWSGMLTSPLCKDKNLDDIAQEYVEGVKEFNPTPDWNLVHTAVCYGYHLAEQKEQKPEFASASTIMIPSCWEEKQKEQKPDIEICQHSFKSKSYKENYYPIENCDYGLEIAYDILEKTFGEVRGYQTDDGIREHQTAIEAVRKAREQKPTEWSEEDEKMRIKIMNFLSSRCSVYDYEEIEEWLKSLRPQPHWKPSEEQMNSLNYGIYVLEEEGYDASASKIKELYVQLKKLMEE